MCSQLSDIWKQEPFGLLNVYERAILKCLLETGCNCVGGINEDQVRQIIPCEHDIERIYILNTNFLHYNTL